MSSGVGGRVWLSEVLTIVYARTKIMIDVFRICNVWYLGVYSECGYSLARHCVVF